MMFVYFGYLVHLRQRIGRGFYEEGSGPIPCSCRTAKLAASAGGRGAQRRVGGDVARRNIARSLAVPLEHYGAARRLLRDKIGEHAIQFQDTGLNLGGHDERDVRRDGRRVAAV